MDQRTTARDLYEAVVGLRAFLVGYEDALIQAALALLTRQHMIVVGPTGQGKSTFLSLVADLFDDALVFRPQLSAFSTPDHLIGPPIPALYRREGKQIYYTDGGLCDCHLGMLEEWPDAGVALARALNTILLERRFVSKDQIVECRLHSAFLTGNRLPAGEGWEAVRARQLFVFDAPAVKSVAGRFAAMQSMDRRRAGKYARAGIPFGDVQALAAEVDRVRVSPGVRLVLAWCLARVEERCAARSLPSHLMNTRSQNALLSVLRAVAMVDEAKEAGYTHLRALRHVLPGGERAEWQEARRTWEEVVALAVPPQAGLQDFRRYEQLGALLEQVQRPRPAGGIREIVFDLPFTAAKLLGETGFLEWMASCRGQKALEELADEVRRAGHEAFRGRASGGSVGALL